MSCRKMHELMSLYLDNALELQDREKLQAHLATCQDCRNKLNLMQQIPVALNADRMLAPQSDFTAFVMQRLIVSEQVQKNYQVTAKTADNSLDKMRVVALDTTKQPKTRANPARPIFQYSLRMASLAAVFVVFLVGVAVMGIGSVTETQASIGAGINSFAIAVQDSFQNPLVLIAGIAVTIVLAGFFWWYLLVRPKKKF